MSFSNLPKNLFVYSLLVVLAVGCGRSSSETGERPSSATHQGMTAEQYLHSVFARYRNAESYRDEGKVRLSFQVGGNSRSEAAPLRVWFDRNVLYLDAYDVHLRQTPDSFDAWITDPTTQDFDSQVVRRPSPLGRPRIDTLLSDTVLSERIAAGLAGPPPQLDWLFAAEPMKLLFDGPYQIGFGKPVTVEEQACLTVIVQADDDAYRFAIDRRRGVIRQVQLPSIRAPIRFQTSEAARHTDADSTQSIRLTLELNGATFESPTQQPALAEQPRLPRRVSHFIPLPPEQPSQLLNTRLSKFREQDQSGQVTLTQRGIDRDYTLLLLASDHPSDLASAANLIHWSYALPQPMRDRVGAALVVSEAAFRRLPRDCPLPLFIDDDSIQNKIGADVGDLVIVNRDAQIVWIQNGVMPDSIARLGRIVGDLLDGVDVPARLQSQWQSDQATYQAVLDAEVARHAGR